MDYCCEDEVAGKAPGLVVERQRRTTAMARLFWRNYRHVPWVWVPTVQGWLVEDYARHAKELRPLALAMRRFYDKASPFRVGVATLCRRASSELIVEIVGAVAAELPDVSIHLWGVKLRALRHGLPPAVISVDSAAWSGLFAQGIEERRRSGLSDREYGYKVALPRYLRKVRSALTISRRPMRPRGRESRSAR